VTVHVPGAFRKGAIPTLLLLLMFLSIAQAPAAQESQPEEFRALLYKRLDEKNSAPFQDAALYLRWFFKPNLLSWNEERDLAMRKIAADILRGSPPAESLPAFGFDRMENQDGILTNLSFSIAPSFLNGEKAVFAFFKTTCGYCERELKELDRYRSARLGTETDASPMNMVGIGLPSGLPEIFDNLESFHQKLELGFPLFKANDKRIMAAYRIRSVPLLILFNEQGKPESTVHFPNQANLGKKLRIILDSFNDGTLQDLLAFANDSKAVQADNSVLALADSNSIFADFYTDPACESCTDFLDNELAAMEKSLGVRFSFTSHDIMDSNSLSRLSAIMESRNVTLRATPVAVIGTRIFQGLREIREGLAQTAADTLVPDEARSTETGQDALPALSAIPVFFAGLADGVNPCAFSTLLFLLSFLGLAGKNKGELLILGAVYTLTVFAGYFALGLGLLASLRALTGFPAFARTMRTLLTLLLGLLALANIRDGILDLRGSRKDMALVLPGALRQRIHATIRRQRNLGFLLGGTALTALMVSLFELACTGQVYLPVIAWMVRKGESSRGLGLLALYNTGFILPLAALFLLAWSGRAIKPVADWFESRVWLSKFLLAAILMVFLVLQLLR
jgi:cytochrome c biogenesis protein CcdA/thiol-disulfide isomerase/thioredoxin